MKRVLLIASVLSLQLAAAVFLKQSNGARRSQEGEEIHAAFFITGSRAAEQALAACSRFADVTWHFVADADARSAIPDTAAVNIYNLEQADPLLQDAGLECCRQPVCFPSLAKLFAFKLLPLDRVLVLDTDLYVNCNLHDLWKEFDAFSDGAVVALAAEQAASYHQAALNYFRPGPRAPSLGGFNGGVQLQYLARMRDGKYQSMLNKPELRRLCGTNMLADQGVFTDLRRAAPELVHELPCSWNVQASLYWATVLKNITDPKLAPYRCQEPVCICHANTGGLWGKCAKGENGWEVVGPDATEALQRAAPIQKQHEWQDKLKATMSLFGHSGIGDPQLDTF